MASEVAEMPVTMTCATANAFKERIKMQLEGKVGRSSQTLSVRYLKEEIFNTHFNYGLYTSSFL